MRVSLAALCACWCACSSEPSGANARSAAPAASGSASVVSGSPSVVGSSDAAVPPIRNAEREALALAPFDPTLTDAAELSRRVEQAFALCAAPRPPAVQTPAVQTPAVQAPTAKLDKAASSSVASLCSTETLSKLHLLRANALAANSGAAAVQEFTLALDYDPSILVAPDEPEAVISAFSKAKAELTALVRRGPVSVSAGKSEQLLGAELDRFAAHFTACYRVGLWQSPALQGSIELALSLGQAEGERVVVAGDLADEGVKRCFADVAQRSMVERRQGPAFKAKVSFTLARG